MLQARGDLNLPPESFGVDLGVRIRRENLDDDAAGERGVGYEEDVRHASATELSLEDVRGAELSEV